MENLGLWSASERAAFYRQKADDALRRAASCSDPSIKLGFEELAAKWAELAKSVQPGVNESNSAAGPGKQ